MSNTDANTAALHQHEASVAKYERAYEAAEGEAARELYADARRFHEVLTDDAVLGYALVTDAGLENNRARWPQLLKKYTESRAVELPALQALHSIWKDASFKRPLTEREQILAEWLELVMGRHIHSEAERIAESQ